MTQLTEFYSSVLELCNIELVEYGRLAITTVNENGEEEKIHLQYNRLPIIFPEKQYMNAVQNKEASAIVFHPLSESSLRNPSEVQEIIRKVAIVRLCELGLYLVDKAVKINHEIYLKTIKPTPTLNKLFIDVPEVDKKFATFVDKIMDVMRTSSKERLFNIFIKQQGEIGNNKFDRVTVISSPLYDELRLGGTDNKVFGVDIGRKKDLTTFIALLESLFPELKNNGYIEGSSNGTAPTLLSFMEAMSTIGKRFNEVLASLGRETKDNVSGNIKGVNWDRNINLSALRNVVPLAEYNIGVSKEKASEQDEEVQLQEKRRVTSTRLVGEEEEVEVNEEREPVKPALNKRVAQELISVPEKSQLPDSRKKRDNTDPSEKSFFWNGEEDNSRSSRGYREDRRPYRDERPAYNDRGNGRYDDRDRGYPSRREEPRGRYNEAERYSTRLTARPPARPAYDDRYDNRRRSSRDDRYDDRYDNRRPPARDDRYDDRRPPARDPENGDQWWNN